MLFGGGFPPTAGDGPASARLSVDSKRSPHEFGTKKIPAHLRERLNPVNRLGSPLDKKSRKTRYGHHESFTAITVEHRWSSAM